MPTRSSTVLLISVMTWAGCPRPTVDITEEIGVAGEFCVTPSDCESGLSCVERSCCSAAGCSQICSSLMEKDGTAVKANMGRHLTMDRFYRRRCVSLCCGGADSGKIERVLGAWTQGPEHGLSRRLNSP